MDLGYGIHNWQRTNHGQRLALTRVNLVGQSIKVFTKRVGKHPWLIQTYRRTKFWAFGQAKAWIQNIQRLTTKSTGSGS
jgi:hypothetical protein